jgi:hypothetical protein
VAECRASGLPLARPGSQAGGSNVGDAAPRRLPGPAGRICSEPVHISARAAASAPGQHLLQLQLQLQQAGRSTAQHCTAQHRAVSAPARLPPAQVRLLASVAHPNVIRYHEAFLDGHRLCIVMELAPDGDLSKVIQWVALGRGGRGGVGGASRCGAGLALAWGSAGRRAAQQPSRADACGRGRLRQLEARLRFRRSGPLPGGGLVGPGRLAGGAGSGLWLALLALQAAAARPPTHHRPPAAAGRRKHQLAHKPMPEDRIWKLFIQAVQGIAALHQLQVWAAVARAGFWPPLAASASACPEQGQPSRDCSATTRSQPPISASPLPLPPTPAARCSTATSSPAT